MLKSVCIFICVIYSLSGYSIEVVTPLESSLQIGQSIPGYDSHREAKIAKITEEFIKVSTKYEVIYYRYPVLFDPEEGFSRMSVRVGDILHNEIKMNFVVTSVKKNKGEFSISVLPCGQSPLETCDSLRQKIIEKTELEVSGEESSEVFIIDSNTAMHIDSCAFELCIGDEVVAEGISNRQERPIAIGRISKIMYKDGEIRYAVDFESPWSMCTFRPAKLKGLRHAKMPPNFHRLFLYKLNEQYHNKEVIGDFGSSEDSIVYIHARVEENYYLYSYEPWNNREQIFSCPQMFVERTDKTY